MYNTQSSWRPFMQTAKKLETDETFCAGTVPESATTML